MECADHGCQHCRICAIARQTGCGRLRRPGAGADRRLLLACATARHDPALAAFQQRGGLDHRQLLRRLHGLGAGARHLDGPRRPQTRLSLRRRGHRGRPSDVCHVRRGLLVGAGDARTDRHGLGGHLHDRPQASRRPRRREDDVARHSRPRRQHRHLGGAVVRLRRSYRSGCRLACGLLRRRHQRRCGMAGLRWLWLFPRKAGTPLRPRMRKASTISGRYSGTGRRWRTPSPTASTRWR